MRTQLKTGTQRHLTKAALSVLMAAVLVGLSTPVYADELGSAEVNVYLGCNASTHLMGIKASISGVAPGDQLQASYNIGGGTDHSLGVVWTGQLGIGSTNTVEINSPYPQTWINVTIGSYHGQAWSLSCP
ncbi:hypothetical protein J2Y69_002949 [Microbacterium resistens]|uniref:Secreted protein n=1 Tax=Microbacterium resistens TaxID=156977 RepID=A0ABU1SFG9_9MICO|nr:hypothetical protein [Microbacterium resistens]MDR6868335.1 hypothetical protein [Microbacterium resistens]